MFSFGSDPEFMLTRDDNLVSAIEVLGKGVEDRIPIDGGHCYYDNVNIEMDIVPSYSREEAITNFGRVLKSAAAKVFPCKINARASDIFPDSELQNPIAQVAGCSPEFCAYRMVKIEGDDGAAGAIKNGNLRSCGGHIHLGSDYLMSQGPEPIFAIYALDLFLGLPSLLLDKDPTSARRKQLYGKAGRYRAKEYGIEYRTLGNFWLASPELVGLVYDICEKTLDILAAHDKEFWSFDEDKFFELNDLGQDPGAAFTFNHFDKYEIKKLIDGDVEFDIGKQIAYEDIYWRPYLGNELTDRILQASENQQQFVSSWGI